MNHLIKYNLFESDDFESLINDDLNDICLDLEDDGFYIRLGVSGKLSRSIFIANGEISPHLIPLSDNLKVFKYSDVSNTIDRLISYIKQSDNIEFEYIGVTTLPKNSLRVPFYNFPTSQSFIGSSSVDSDIKLVKVAYRIKPLGFPSEGPRDPHLK